MTSNPLTMLEGVNLGRDTKYATKNPLAKRLIAGYFTALDQLVSGCEFNNLLEVGCGEGIPLRVLGETICDAEKVGVDILMDKLQLGKVNAPEVSLAASSIYELPFEDRSFDLVMCCEVLEHLDQPVEALEELNRVAKKGVVLSVPNEPLWRILNMARGAYLAQWGNTPDHIQHWSASSFVEMVKEVFWIEKISKPTPWLMVLCRKK